MIQEEYVTFETAKLLREVGFNLEVESVYFVNAKRFCTISPKENFNQDHPVMISAPTQALAMRWLREEKKLHVEIYTTTVKHSHFSVCIMAPFKHLELNRYVTDWAEVKRLTDSDGVFYLTYPSYEQAAEAGIKAACEYILNQKQQ